MRDNSALEQSIRKWQYIATGRAVNRGSVDCALCKQYVCEADDIEDGGLACPVAVATNQADCAGSPYADFQSASNGYSPIYGEEHHGSARSKEAKKAAWKMVRFLEGLRA